MLCPLKYIPNIISAISFPNSFQAKQGSENPQILFVSLIQYQPVCELHHMSHLPVLSEDHKILESLLLIDFNRFGKLLEEMKKKIFIGEKIPMRKSLNENIAT